MYAFGYMVQPAAMSAAHNALNTPHHDGRAHGSARYALELSACQVVGIWAVLTMDPSRATESERTAVPTSGTSSQLQAPAVRSHTRMLPRLSPAARQQPNTVLRPIEGCSHDQVQGTDFQRQLQLQIKA